MRKYRIAAIGGDGIGPEVLSAGIACIQEVGRLEGFEIVVKEFPWGSAYYRETGKRWKSQIPPVSKSLPRKGIPRL